MTEQGKNHDTDAEKSPVADNIRDLMAKTGERRKTDPSNENRWDSVLNNLENALEEAESGLDSSARMIEQLPDTGQSGPSSQPASGKHVSGALPRRQCVEEQLFDAEPPPQEILEKELPPEDPYAAARSVLETPMEELGDLTLQELALAKSYLDSLPGGISPLPIERSLNARLELANQAPHSAHGIDDNKRRTQNMLRKAVKKVKAKHVEELTVEEVDLITNGYTLLTQKIKRKDNDDRLLELLHNSMDKLEDRCGDLKKKLAEKRLQREQR